MKRIDHMTALRAVTRFAGDLRLGNRSACAGDPLSQHWADDVRNNIHRRPNADGMELHIWRLRGDGTDIRLFKYVNGMDKGFTVCLRKGIPVEIRAKDHTKGSPEMDMFLQMLYGDNQC